MLTGRPLWSLTADVELKDDGGLVACTRWGDIRIDDDREVIRNSLRRMTLGPVRLENVPGLEDAYLGWRTGDRRPDCAWSAVRRVLDKLTGCVVASLELPDVEGAVLAVVPISSRAVFRIRPDPPVGSVALVSGCELEDYGDQCMMSAESAHHRVDLLAPVAELGRRLMRGGGTARDLADALPLDERAVADVASYLVGAGLATVGRLPDPVSR
ncbi:hypothetical protein [Actinocorallia populi]|uniref:hypothetical protein n=1 Tax=Actinocorallia populi TaxID=2079200 RepID=UPI000D08E2C9|nr:hypothetical protein [Actinocorallia populi]